MDEQNLNSYIEQLELLRELESRNLIRSEVAAKHQDSVVTKMLQSVSNTAMSGNNEEDLSSPSYAHHTPALSSSRDYIFISYSHKDQKWLEMLRRFFAPFADQEKIHLWSDTQILPGAVRREEIQKVLACTKVAVLLVSADFLDSDSIKIDELLPLLKAAEKNGLTILWIAVSHCLYIGTGIAHYQPVNDPMKPLKSFKGSRLDQELVSVCEHIKRAMKQ